MAEFSLNQCEFAFVLIMLHLGMIRGFFMFLMSEVFFKVRINVLLGFTLIELILGDELS